MNKYLTKFLSFLLSHDQKDWDTQVPVALYYYNNAPSDRKTDYTPFYLLYGRHGRSPLSFKLPSVNEVPTHVQGYVTDLVNKLAEAHEVAKENTRVHQEKMKEYYDKKSTPTKLKGGDKVFLYLEKTPPNLSRKLTHKYVGPYYIARFVRNNTVKLRKVDSDKLLKAPVHVDRLKKCIYPVIKPEQDLSNIAGALPDLCDSDINDDEFSLWGPLRQTCRIPMKATTQSTIWLKMSFINATQTKGNNILSSGKIFPHQAIPGLTSPI